MKRLLKRLICWIFYHDFGFAKDEDNRKKYLCLRCGADYVTWLKK